MSNIANAAQKWQNAMKSATTKQNYIDGVNAVTQSPMEAAATDAAMNLYLQKVQDSVSSGRRRAALLAVPLSTWKAQATGVGANNLSSGATKGAQKVLQNFQQFGNVYIQASQAAAAIPNDGTMATALAKVQASIMTLKQGFGKSTN